MKSGLWWVARWALVVSIASCTWPGSGLAPPPMAASASSARQASPGDATRGANAPLALADRSAGTTRQLEAEANAPLPLYGALVTYRVDHYDTWRAAFDADLPARKEAGFAAQGVLHGLRDPNLVAVWIAVTDLAKARAYFADKTSREFLRSSGVRGKPQVRLWSNAAADMELGHQHLCAAFVKLRVEDFELLQARLAAAGLARAAASIVGYALSRDVDDEHVAYLYLQSEQPTNLNTYLAARDTKQAWREAGLRGAPSVTLLREGELTTLYR